LLAIAEGKLKKSKEEFRALIAFRRVRGYHRRKPDKRAPLAGYGPNIPGCPAFTTRSLRSFSCERRAWAVDSESSGLRPRVDGPGHGFIHSKRWRRTVQ